MYNYGTAGEHGEPGLVRRCQFGTKYDNSVRQQLTSTKISQYGADRRKGRVPIWQVHVLTSKKSGHTGILPEKLSDAPADPASVVGWSHSGHRFESPVK